MYFQTALLSSKLLMIRTRKKSTNDLWIAIIIKKTWLRYDLKQLVVNAKTIDD